MPLLCPFSPSFTSRPPPQTPLAISAFRPFLAAEAVILACYLVAGALIGYVLERQTFLWVFLLTYLPVRLFTSGSLGPIPYSALAGSVAYCVARPKSAAGRF